MKYIIYWAKQCYFPPSKILIYPLFKEIPSYPVGIVTHFSGPALIKKESRLIYLMNFMGSVIKWIPGPKITFDLPRPKP